MPSCVHICARTRDLVHCRPHMGIARVRGSVDHSPRQVLPAAQSRCAAEGHLAARVAADPARTARRGTGTGAGTGGRARDGHGGRGRGICVRGRGYIHGAARSCAAQRRARGSGNALHACSPDTLRIPGRVVPRLPRDPPIIYARNTSASPARLLAGACPACPSFPRGARSLIPALRSQPNDRVFAAR